jgi:hypothetical protein
VLLHPSPDDAGISRQQAIPSKMTVMVYVDLKLGMRIAMFCFLKAKTLAIGLTIKPLQ